MKELVLQLSLLITCLLFLFYPLPGTLPAGQGAPGLNRGTGISISWLLSIPCPLAWSHPLCLSSSLKPKRKEISPFSPENLYLFVLILFASVGPTKALYPLLPHCVAIDSVLSGKKLIQALPRLTIRLLVNGLWVHPTC